MRIFPSRRRAANRTPGASEAGGTAIVLRQSSLDRQRSNISQDPNIQTESDNASKTKKWLPTFKKNKKDADDQPQRISPFALHANEELSPRSSAWLYIAAVSIAGLSSFLVTEEAIDDAMEDQSGGGRSTKDIILIVILSISFALSFIITLSYRHRGLREKLTGEIRRVHSSFEFVMSFIMFAIWCMVLRYVTDPFSGLNYGLTMLTSDGQAEVWNTNLWICAWLGWGLSSYLAGALIMASPTSKMG
ncbi:hypothetical protein ACHAXR_003774, partial [Thalassiosira sp. AJA248-18]